MDEPPKLFRESRLERVRGDGAPATGVKFISGIVCASWAAMEEGKYFSDVSSQTKGAEDAEDALGEPWQVTNQVWKMESPPYWRTNEWTVALSFKFVGAAVAHATSVKHIV